VFEGFFYALRAHGVPVAMDEWLLLQEALGRGLADSSLSRFHALARSLLVKSERHFDDYDVAFAAYFDGVEQADDGIADHVWRWLDEHPEAFDLTDDQRAQIDRAMERIDLDAMRQHRCPRRFARAYAKDRARFLRNWPADSALYRLLDQRLPQVPGTCPE